MALPILDTPKYELTLPSGQIVTYRPFLVKEQKILLTALQTGSRSDSLRGMMEVVHTCTFGSVNVNKIPTFELEILFLNIRAKSVGEELPVNIKCDKCGEPNPYDVKLLDEMTLDNYKKPEPVKLQDDYGLMFSYPTIVDMIVVSKVPTDDPTTFYIELAKLCLQGVFQGEEYFTAADATPEEKNKVFNQLGPTQYGKIVEFFDNVPMLSYNLKFKCKKCGHDNVTKIEGTDSFFG